MDFFTNKFFLLAITFGFYFLSKVIQKKTYRLAYLLFAVYGRFL